MDEVAHFQYALFLKEQKRLPIQPTEPGEQLTVVMGHHPPLYYAITAMLLASQSTSHSREVFRPNPHFVWKENSGDNGWNVMIHAGQDTFPGEGVVRAFLYVRLLGILCGIITLFALFQAFQTAFSSIDWFPLLATAVIAFNPSFIYMSSTIHHDILQAMWFALGAWWMMRFLQRRTKYAAFVAGLLVGCAMLTKISGVVLGLGVATVIVGRSIQERDWSTFRRDGLISAGTAFLISGGWFVRNRVLYGDFLGWKAYSHVFSSNLRDEPSFRLGVVEFFQQASRNFWGGFGFMHITFPEISRYLWIAVAVALAGWIILILRNRRFFTQYRIVLIAAAVLLLGMLAIYLRFATINLGAGHGRYLFPAAFSIGILLAGGVFGLVGQSMLKWTAIIVAIGLAIYAVWLPVVYLLPKYAPPTMLDTLPANAEPVNLWLSDGVMLKGYHLETSQPLVPGTVLDTILYWQTDTNNGIVNDPKLELTLQTPDGEVITSDEGWLSPGMPPDSWPRNKLVMTQHSLFIPATELPETLYLATQADNVNERLTIAELLTVGGATEIQTAELPDDLNVLFADELLLRGYELSPNNHRPGDTLAVTLLWQVQQKPVADHTLFVHLLDASGQLVTQLDRPIGGPSSPTSTWREGQAWRDSYPILLPESLPAGTYSLQIGMYDWPSLERLPITNTEEDTLTVTEIEVSK